LIFWRIFWKHKR